MNSLLVEELWKRMEQKDHELHKLIDKYIDNGTFKLSGTRESQRTQVISIVDHIQGVRQDMIRYMNQWREFKRIEEDK